MSKVTTENIAPEDRVAVGNKPKAKINPFGKPLLRTKGLVIHLNLKPSIPTNVERLSPEPNRAKLFAIPIREQRRHHSFKVKLDLPEQDNPFYSTEKHRHAFIQTQLKEITSSLGLTYFGEVVFEEWVSLLEDNGWSVDVELQTSI